MKTLFLAFLIALTVIASPVLAQNVTDLDAPLSDSVSLHSQASDDSARKLQDANPGNYDKVVATISKQSGCDCAPCSALASHHYVGGGNYHFRHSVSHSHIIRIVPVVPKWVLARLKHNGSQSALAMDGVVQAKSIGYQAIAQGNQNHADIQTLNTGMNALGGRMDHAEQDKVKTDKSIADRFKDQGGLNRILEWVVGTAIVLALIGLISSLLSGRIHSGNIRNMNARLVSVEQAAGRNDNRLLDVESLADSAHSLARAAYDAIHRAVQGLTNRVDDLDDNVRGAHDRLRDQDRRMGEIERRINGSPGIIP